MDLGGVRGFARVLPLTAAVSLVAVLARAGEKEPLPPQAPYPEQQQAQQQPKAPRQPDKGRRRTASASTPRAASDTPSVAPPSHTPVAPELRQLTLTPAWEGRYIQLAGLNARLQQIAVRGSIAVAPADAKVLVIDAAAGAVIRDIELPSSASGSKLLGIVLDGDFAVFATDNGLLAKLKLDGTYAWVVSGIKPVAAPLILDVDGDKTNDVVVVSEDGISSWNGINGGPLKRVEAAICAYPRVRLGRANTASIVVNCDGVARTYFFSSDPALDRAPRREDAPRELVAFGLDPQTNVLFQSAGSGVEAPSNVDVVSDINWSQVSTISADDIDGDGFWDLLIARNARLYAYSTRATGGLYQSMPFELSGLSPLYETFSNPGPGDNVDRFRPAPFTSIEGFDRVAEAAVADLFPAATLSVPLEQRPLLRDIQTNADGTYAHDGANLLARRAGDKPSDTNSGFKALPLPTDAIGAQERPITALSVISNSVALAYADRLVTCDSSGGRCSVEQRRRVRALTSGSAESMFWLGTTDGMVVSYDALTESFGREISAKRTGSLAMLTRIGEFIMASGSNGTLVFSTRGRDSIHELQFVPFQVQQALQCSTRGSYYALSNGELLETANLTSAFEKVQGQPNAIRALRCNEEGSLVLLTSDRGVYVLRGPLYPSWPVALFLVACCLGVFLFVVHLNYRRPKPAGQVDADECVRLGIRTDLPLTTLPQNSDSKLTGLVNALVRFIDNQDTQPPITIGVYGPWGSGKSSAMRLVQRALEDKRRYISVWFNPWRFHREKDIAAALLQSVVLEVRERAGLGRVNIALRRLLKAPALLKLAWFVPIVLISFHMVKYPHMWPANITLIGKELFSTELAGSSLLTISGIGGLVRFVLSGRKLFEFDPAALLGEASQEKRVDFIRHFSDELAEVLDSLPRAQQVVIFIDDLDRCPPDQTLAMLEALQLLTESQRCYFVLGMDETIVQSAIELKYRDLLELKKSQGGDTTGFGAHYLEKIITLAVHVPRVRAGDVETAPQSAAGESDTADKRASASFDAPKSNGWISPGQGFLLGWLTLCAIGFAFLFSLSGPALPSRPAEPETTNSAAVTPSTPTSEKATPPGPEAGPTIQTGVVVSDLRFAANARETARARPAAAARSVSAQSTQAADHDYQASRAELVGVVIASLAVCAALLALAALLFFRMRAVGAVPPPAKDSEEFNRALRIYLDHLPQNPRKLIRSGNIARFMYYLVARKDATRTPAGFFACLLAEQQLRPIAGETVPSDVLALAAATRGPDPDRRPEIQQRFDQIYATWNDNDVSPLPVDGPLDPRFCEELRSWLRGTAT